MGRALVVVSHACVLASNRAVYESLAGDVGVGDVTLVVPRRWRTAFAPRGLDAERGGRLAPLERRVVGKGRPQRHAYVARCAVLLRERGARVLLVEEEPFSVATWQWRRAAHRARVPFGVQLAETIDRDLPSWVARLRDRALSEAAFVVARSPLAASLAARWGASGEVAVVPHDVPAVAARPEPGGPFTVAFVGRLVEEKGLSDLLAAVQRLEGVRLVVAGAGPLAASVAAAGPHVELLGPVVHGDVGAVYDRAHVTCVPSRTTPRWEEQFGRVAVESLVRGVPVVAADTGALPWVLSRTGGGVGVPERDPAAIAEAVAALRDDPARRRALGAAGREGALRSFSTPVVARELAALLERVR